MAFVAGQSLVASTDCKLHAKNNKMTSRKNKSRYILFGWLLPICFLLPELINIGFMYLRWDYLLVAIYVLAIIASKSTGGSSLGWSRRTLIIFTLYIAFSIYQLSSLQSKTGILEGVKYASWPIKVLIWGAGMCLIYSKLNCSMWHVYIFIRNTAALVFVIQVLELSFPDFRGMLFDFYPVSSRERLLELTFRARGPFNGYDLTSIYYLVSGVFVHQYYRSKSTPGMKRLLVYGICLAGAFISARTGFLLLLAYLVVSIYQRFHVFYKVQVLLLVAAIIGSLCFGSMTVPSGVDDGIAGRYFELIGAIFSGDLGGIASVAGTFDMNETLLGGGGVGAFGQGLTTETTADQLYFKYLFMFGYAGLLVWVFIHACIVAQAYCSGDTTKTFVTYRRAVFVGSILMAFAHIKGGNYFFSSRLGDIFAFLLILSTLSPRLTPIKAIQCREGRCDDLFESRGGR